MIKDKYLSGIEVVKYDSFEDHRGQLFTVWNDNKFLNNNIYFNHDKITISKKNVLRGLHTDKSWKLITCVFGKIQLAVVNFDKNSPEYLYHNEFILDAKNKYKTSILVPPYYLNGHLVLSDEAVFHYKWSYEGKYPDSDDQISIKWDDPNIKINWIVNNPELSFRDQNSSYI